MLKIPVPRLSQNWQSGVGFEMFRIQDFKISIQKSTGSVVDHSWQGPLLFCLTGSIVVHSWHFFFCCGVTERHQETKFKMHWEVTHWIRVRCGRHPKGRQTNANQITFTTFWYLAHTKKRKCMVVIHLWPSMDTRAQYHHTNKWKWSWYMTSERKHNLTEKNMLGHGSRTSKYLRATTDQCNPNCCSKEKWMRRGGCK